MNSAIERLLSLRVADVMRRDVSTVTTDLAMPEAAKGLLRSKISGVPVVDVREHCVGVLSAVDFVRREVESPPADRDGDKVRTFMSSSVYSVESDVTLINAARAMCRHHVHRLPVLDRTGQVVGLISSLDLVAAMVHVVEE
jgi:CBS-domain-containing membrane protein